MRQSLASHFGAMSFVHFAISPLPSTLPPCMFLNDRLRLCIPGFGDILPIQISHAPIASLPISCLPITKNIEILFPKWIMRGSFGTSWNAMAATMSKNIDKMSLFFSTFLCQKTYTKQFPGQKAMRSVQTKLTRDQVRHYIERMIKLAPQIGEDTEKCDDMFPMSLLDHLIDNSRNANKAQISKAAWM